MDLEKFIAGLHDYLGRALSPLAARIKAVEERPLPKDGIPGRDGIDGKDGAPGRDGKDGVAGRDGVDGKDGSPGRDGVDGKDGSPGRDGVDGKDGAPGRDGQDGEPGAPGKSIVVEDVMGLLEQLVEQRQAKWELDFERRAQGVLERAVDRMPKPKDGRDGADGTNGKDGRDALDLDDLVIERSGERGILIRFQRGESVVERTLQFPLMIYRGVYVDGRTYEPGDTATFAGGLWHCDAATSDKPGEPGSKGWTLAAKRGRDGKDGRDLAPRSPQPIKVS